MKTRLFFSVVSATAAAAAVALLAGCSTVDVGGSRGGGGEMQAVYQYGEFSMLLNSTAPAAARAAEAAIKDLDLYEVSKTLNTYDATLAARTRKDEKVSIKIAEVNSRQTMLRIRVGTTGDLAVSRQIYDSIERNLAAQTR
ncbi:DUF3568 family protein [Opitutaceae bacterium TAV4]|uniref:DUF3568 family protein n=1 Tax=Geminisphaera colitermitum TaxID=1148786 RepID=UPI0002E2BDB5|nr:DUF3568 family protein [Geminisphaera colitermitum]RRJ95536.1 DUF3568 family protein [Opitutaceae bacterium TAV4]RRJ99842.1 DUF3568 family protein [Opitutaceae bacterium TAV3]